MRTNRADDWQFAKVTIASRHCESGFTLLELTFTLLLVPLFIALLVHMLAFGGALYEQPRGNVTMTPQLFVRKVIDSRDCTVNDGRLAGVYVRPDKTTWAWTLKQINGNLVMVGEGGGNLLFIRGIDRYHVETVGSGYRVRWADATGEREKYVMCMRAASFSSLL
ncbi:hypothetical protein [Exiguobacterium sp.]|uniref:hypothetical protein n=1 Tax=Exiguobacterium sp. TaxID=44751 RepID=UPI00263A62D3|nr:hypothetical protein [Exiguobacterium sp.]MCC5893185.1 hypothetical protein [Exiguobacterium sp.]